MSGDSLKWLGDHAAGFGVLTLLSGGGVLAYLKWLFPHKKSAGELDPVHTSAVAQEGSAALSIGAAATVSAPVIVGSNNVQHITNMSAATQVHIRERKPTSPTANEIRQQEKSLPPFQQGHYLEQCRGLKVKWPCTFRDVHDDRKWFHDIPAKGGVQQATWTVSLSYGLESWGARIWCKHVSIEDYPIVRVAHAGHVVWVEGEIDRIDSGFIELTNVTLEFE